jgi:hypothetical protein
MKFFYKDYYKRAIADNTRGLKLVLGGTGLGKTSSLAALMGSADCPEDVKFIYVANRVQLLDEMAEQVRKLGVNTIKQGSDEDQLKEAIEDGSLDELLTQEAFLQLIEDFNQRDLGKDIRLDAIKKNVKKFKSWSKISAADAQTIAEEQSALSSELLRPLKQLFGYATRLAEQRPKPTQKISQKRAGELIEHRAWRQLFPYSHFRSDPTLTLLLVTVQKGFHGVFNGKQAIHLGRWEAPLYGRYVFVFDEFDFLENDLLAMLSQERNVSEPFGFVRTFYERINREKLTHDDYLTRKVEWKKIREDLTEICERLDKLKEEHGIDFPPITHFVTKDKALRDKAIFQSNYSLATQPIFLRHPSSRAHSFELTTERSGRKAFILLDVVSREVKNIIRLFKRLQIEHEDIYPELLRQCFGNTDYRWEIERVKQIGSRHEWCETNYGNLLTNGFGLFVIEANRSQLTDPEEVAMSYLSLNNSPEAIIRELCKSHLVFGLSATAHIPRTLRNFDWQGLAHPMLPGDSFVPLPITEEDVAEIELANARKAAIRGNELQLVIAEPLATASKLGQQLIAIASHSSDVFEGNTKLEFRLKRVSHFFGLLARIAQMPQETDETQTHLAFLGSLKQVDHLLRNIREDEECWFKATAKPLSRELARFKLYEVEYRDEDTGREIICNVVLYDAQLGREMVKTLELEEKYNALFWEGKPVVVVTTYPSAGNGVNLQYYPTREAYEAKDGAAKRDFTHLHLLDAPYFYFDGVKPEQTHEDNQAAIKRDVYGVMKLLYAKLISEDQARGKLRNIKQLNSFNTEYLTLSDGLLNQFSVFVQALGRIERVWQKMPNQWLHLDKDVYRVFERLVRDETLASEYQQYQRFASPSMRHLLKLIEERAHHHRHELDNELLSIHQANAKARDAIRQLVNEIKQFRVSKYPPDIRERWQQLREDVLKHNMQAKSLHSLLGGGAKAVKGVFHTNYVRDGVLYINAEGEIAPPTVMSYEFEAWNLNAVYRPLTVEPNTVITNFFRVRGYELAFLDSGWYFLPYIYQAILAGAIGEEAISAVLTIGRIRASGKAIPDELFEVADLRVEDRPIFIDCKNYGTRTLDRFALPEDDPFYHPTLNEEHFKTRMVIKWQQINAVFHHESTEPCRLIVMNLVSDDVGTVRYYDQNFEYVEAWEPARIIVLTGALKHSPSNAKDLLTDACQQLLSHLRQ